MLGGGISLIVARRRFEEMSPNAQKMGKSPVERVKIAIMAQRSQRIRVLAEVMIAFVAAQVSRKVWCLKDSLATSAAMGSVAGNGLNGAYLITQFIAEHSAPCSRAVAFDSGS